VARSAALLGRCAVAGFCFGLHTVYNKGGAGPCRLDAAEINPQVEELNERIDKLTGCEAVPLRLRRDAELYEADGLHLSPRRGYPELLAQLARLCPPLAATAVPAEPSAGGGGPGAAVSCSSCSAAHRSPRALLPAPPPVGALLPAAAIC